ncbi:hypothetical protein B0T16DRAFT_410657 [Cercophora newfieldiana]|uniref:Uncharacterized protein n=1 Tax=Cercophora newfieldiana TaxID=92897 RepID=A0AA39YCF7_9PEZI|nr:hypothetical protein B0T16DRAFT_410657 [Cercophora newfieldiana]
MAATIVDTYRPAEYQALPHLDNAFDTFLERSPQHIIEEKMMEVFRKHQVYNELAVCLIHRHFDMADNEKLVEFGALSTPWVVRDENMMGGSVKPRSWIFRGGRMIPYEFGFNEWGQTEVYKDLPNKPEFYTEFNAILQAEGLSELLGLTLLTERKKEGIVKVEKTFGRANIVFTQPDSWSEENAKEAVPAQWEYAPGIGDFVVPVKKMLCISGCICHRGLP